MRLTIVRTLFALAWVVLPATALAQSSIAGVVRDATGAVLPGVTVEASSPALIERSRTTVTDGSGQYRIVELRPGIYTVTFTLEGFTTVQREGIELTANFTAPVNAELRIGAVAETITVTGASPVVDIQTVTDRTVMTREVLDAVPTGRNIQAVGILIPGTTLQTGGGGAYSVDVGGSGGMQQSPLVYHGSNDSQQQVNGIRYNNLCGAGQYAGTYWNDGMFQEVSYVTSADSAENGQGGVRINMIPKEGGNTFRGTIFGNFTYDPWQGNNLDDNLRSRGLESVTEIDKIWDLNPSFGGPIVRDRLWFQGTHRYWGVNKFVAGSFSEIDSSVRGIDDGYINSSVLHLTWQPAERHKVSAYYDLNRKYRGHWGINSTTSPEASAIEDMPQSYTTQAKWLATLSNRLLFEYGFGIYFQQYREIYRPEPENPTTPDFLRTHPTTGLVYRPFFATQERSTGQWLGSFRQFNVNHVSEVYNHMAALSYVTGSHELKGGMQLSHGNRETDTYVRGDIIVRYLNGNPDSVMLQATPRLQRENLNADLGLYIQDKWTIRRATLNLGLRYDYFHSEVPRQISPAGIFVPAREFDEVPEVPRWHDLSPRMGISYDLFGNGRTALKGGVNRYVAGLTAGFAGANNPLQTAGGASDTRTWNDANGDRFPDPSEFGPSGNRFFGQPVFTSRYDDDIKTGWFERGYNWEVMGGVQHELFPRVSAEFSFHHRWLNQQPFAVISGAGFFSGTQLVTTDNLLWTPADFDPFCVNIPNDNRLANAGQQLCGLYDVRPAARPLVDNLVRNNPDFTMAYTGYDVTLNARLANGATLGGGVTAGRTRIEDCTVIDNPAYTSLGAQDRGFINALGPLERDCRESPPFLPNYKLLFSYPLPWDLQFAGSFQSAPGPEINAVQIVTSPLAVGLGRPLSGGFALVNLIQPGTIYDERMYQLDLRGSRLFRIGGTRLRVMADLYNIFNNNAVLRRNNIYGPTWGRPDQSLEPRMFKIGAQIDF